MFLLIFYLATHFTAAAYNLYILATQESEARHLRSRAVWARAGWGDSIIGDFMLRLLLRNTSAARAINLAPGVTILVMPDQGEIADNPQGRDNVGGVDVGLPVKTVIGQKANRKDYYNEMLYQN